MKVVAITGPSGPSLAERLAERLEERGRVATVLHPSFSNGDPREKPQSPPVGSSTTYELTETGWIVSGDRKPLTETLDHLAPKYDFAVLVGFDEKGFSQISLGDSDYGDDNLLSAGSAASVNVDDLVVDIVESEPFETLSSLVSRAKASPEAEKAGAIATFTGRVRAKEHDDDVFTKHLEFERYDEIAAERFATIKKELEDRDGVFEVLMHHRTGIVEYGEDIVFVVVLAGHRTQAFATVEDGIDRLKAEVPLFKKEATVDGEFWSHQHDTDEGHDHNHQ